MSPTNVDGRNSLFTDVQWSQLSRTFDLSERQYEVLRLIFEGRSRKAIAAFLGIRVPTVDVHITRLFRRFGVRTTLQLVLRVVGEMLPPPDRSAGNE